MSNKQFWILTILLTVSMILDFTFFVVTTNLTSLLSVKAPESEASDFETTYFDDYIKLDATLIACPDVRVGLKRGMRDGDTHGSITELQQFLISSGYDLGGLSNGDFGPLTEKALKQFQNDQSISVNGIVDTLTFETIMNVCAVE